MKATLTTIFVTAALLTSGASATGLSGLHKTVRNKLENYCHKELDSKEVAQLREKKMIVLNGANYFVGHKEKVPQVEPNEKVELCSGNFTQHRSAPGRVQCSYCTEGKSSQPLFSVSIQITQEVKEKFAKRSLEVSGANTEKFSATSHNCGRTSVKSCLAS